MRSCMRWLRPLRHFFFRSVPLGGSILGLKIMMRLGNMKEHVLNRDYHRMNCVAARWTGAMALWYGTVREATRQEEAGGRAAFAMLW